MIDRTSLFQFLSGRAAALVLLFGLQVAVVRLLPPAEYARYAVVLGGSALLQTVTAFGLPRVAVRFLSGDALPRRAGRRLALTLLAIRGGAVLVGAAATALAFQFATPSGLASWTPLAGAACAYALATALQMDADGMAQALRLQVASRRAAVGEPLARALVLTFLWRARAADAATVILGGAMTAGLATALLVAAVMNALRPDDADSDVLDWRAIRRVARGGYSGTLSWLAFSPAVIRLLASRVLPTEAFAGFSFVQGLTVSLQRYAPSFILSPLIEPAATADAVRTGRTGPMLRVLSLMVTADALVIGAAVLGASVAGAPLILALTHGRYGGAAVFLPWLLALIVVNASHRAVETAAVAADAPEALSRSLGFSLAWLAAAGALTPTFGVWPLLLCPFGDAATRFWIVRQALAQRGSGGASKPLRVMVLTPRGLGGTGGVDRLMDGLRPWLAGRGDLQVRFVTTRGPRRWASPIYTIAAMARLTSARLLRRMDLIHVNLGAYGGCYRKMLLLAIPRLLRTPYVIHLHGSAFAPFWAAAPAPLRAQIDRLFEDAAQVIVLGEDWRRRLEVRVPKAAGRIVVLPNAVAPIKGCRPADRAHVRILFLGELGPRKGAAILIQALAKLRTNPSWSAVIAGDGAVLEVRGLAASLGVADRVALPGWVGPDEVERLLAASDILVLPSFEETLPMAVIEGFAAGLPVIATPVGALPDIITPGETGLFTPPGDVDALARAIDSLIANPDLRLRLGRAAKAYHAEYLSIGRYAERLEAVWRASPGAT